jgi:hypothetical protein
MRNIIFIFIFLSGCAQQPEIRIAPNVEVNQASQLINENQLLDVGVIVFDPGLPDGELTPEELEELVNEGTFENIRKSESIYFSVLLRDALQTSGYWGSVWITPYESNASDLHVTASIIKSDGNEIILQVGARDATGRTWIGQEYTLGTSAMAYGSYDELHLDPYQDIFNEIANDLSGFYIPLDTAEIEDIRNTAQVRFASELSPESFSGYYQQEDTNFELIRLPAENDPQFARTLMVRNRTHSFLELLNHHFDQFSISAQDSYVDWREYSREEAIEIDRLTRSANFRTGMGAAAVVASILYGANSDGRFRDRIVRDSLMYVGMDLIRTTAVRREEKELHTQVLIELTDSFDSQMEPMVVEVEEAQFRLTGTVEDQYHDWQNLLYQIYREENYSLTEIYSRIEDYDGDNASDQEIDVIQNP